jgi:hypothetical protein
VLSVFDKSWHNFCGVWYNSIMCCLCLTRVDMTFYCYIRHHKSQLLSNTDSSWYCYIRHHKSQLLSNTARTWYCYISWHDFCGVWYNTIMCCMCLTRVDMTFVVSDITVSCAVCVWQELTWLLWCQNITFDPFTSPKQ